MNNRRIEQRQCLYAAKALRRRFSVPPAGPAADEFVAKDLGLDAQLLHMAFSDFPALTKTLPAILIAKDGAALILEDALGPDAGCGSRRQGSPVDR